MTKRSSRRVQKRAWSEQPADLRAERETFVRTFLKKGFELTESLLRENESLQELVRKLDDENARLKGLVQKKPAVRDLLGAMQQLEQQRAALTARADELERAYQQQKSQHETLQQEINDLASLYVASFQLGGTLSVRRVVRHVCELLEQLIGAKAFAIYVVDPDGKHARPIASRGMAEKQLTTVSTAEGPIGDVCLTGVQRVLDPIPAASRTREPIAVVPLLLDTRVVGVIAVHALLPHKKGWALVDNELFKLLCAQAASALIGANLYSDRGQPMHGLDGIESHLDAPAEAGGRGTSKGRARKVRTS